ncbi:MAG: MerR family DNA-binding protein [Firmicutes bacterium]|nr:MerR family DNA-binding protein [Alicyclobacillaceae bacterium]MCL6498326.1 MerR family DNA-binding protein [Bacillota bacterium]
MRFILQAKQLGFRLDEMRRILRFIDEGCSPCPWVLELVQAQLHLIARQVAALEATRTRLQQLAALCLLFLGARPRCAP